MALALQATLPQIAPVFQLIGDGANPADRARNAVLLGCVLIGLTTVINAAGVRLMARINNVGVFAELVGVALLIVLLLRAGPARAGRPVSNPGPGPCRLWLGYLGRPRCSPRR